MRIVEQAASALAQVLGNGESVDWQALSPQEQARFHEGVLAVLSALREPDETMAEAGAEIIRSVRLGESRAAHLNDAVNTWRYMIDALRGTRR